MPSKPSCCTVPSCRTFRRNGSHHAIARAGRPSQSADSPMSPSGPADTHESNRRSARATVNSSPCPARILVSPSRVRTCAPIELSWLGKSSKLPSWGTGPPLPTASPANSTPSSSQNSTTDPGLCPGAWITSSVTSAISKMPPCSIWMSRSVPGWASRQASRSALCKATGASSLLVTSKAAATCLTCPCVQITASTSRWPTTFMTASAGPPGSMTITSSSPPMTQVLTGPATRSILACIPSCLPVGWSRAGHVPGGRAATWLTEPDPDQRPDRVDDQLHRDRGQQQRGDPGEQFDAAVPQHLQDDPGEPHGQPERGDDSDNSGTERDAAANRADALDEKHRGDDRARPGEQRTAERHERHVGLGPLQLRRIGCPAGQQFQRHEQEQQAARGLQRGQLDAEVAKNGPAEERERDDHPERDQRGLPGEAVALSRGPHGGHREEDGDDAGRVGDHQQRDKYLPEELDIGDQRGHLLITAAPLARPSSLSRSSCPVVSQPIRSPVSCPWSSLPPVSARPSLRATAVSWFRCASS